MQHLLRGATADGPSALLNVRDTSRISPRTVRVIIAGTASVQLQGRMSTEDSWFSLGTAFTTTGVQLSTLPPQVRFDVSGTDAATIDAWVDAYATL